MRRSARISASCAAAALLLTGAAGCGSAPTGEEGATEASATGSVYESQRTDGVDALLESWGEALRTDDEPALRGLIDSAAPPGFVDSQIRLARNLQTVDFDEFGFSLGDDPEVFVPSDIAQRLDAVDSWGPPVYLDFRLSGVDESTVHTPVGAVVVRRGGGWRLVSTHELQDGTHATLPAGPWDYGPVDSLRVPVDGAGDALVLAHPGDDAQVQDVAGMLPGSIAAVSDFWGTDWDRSVVVEMADTGEEFSGLTGNPPGRTDIAAASISLDSDVPAHGQRVVFAPGAVSRMSADDSRLVLQHELSHMAVRADVGRGAPTWLLEGTADYVAARTGGVPPQQDPIPLVAAVVRDQGPPDELPKNAAFAGPNAALAYQLARSVADYTVAEYGEDGLRAVHAALAGGGLDDAAVDEALDGAIGVDMNTFTTDWSRWLGQRFGG